MDLINDIEIKSRKKVLKASMLEYLEDADPNFTKDDIEKCLTIIDNYLKELSKIKLQEKAMELVEKTVMELNELNEACDEELIETSEREEICGIIIQAGYLKGFNDQDEDIT